MVSNDHFFINWIMVNIILQSIILIHCLDTKKKQSKSQACIYITQYSYFTSQIQLQYHNPYCSSLKQKLSLPNCFNKNVFKTLNIQTWNSSIFTVLKQHFPMLLLTVTSLIMKPLFITYIPGVYIRNSPHQVVYAVIKTISLIVRHNVWIFVFSLSLCI